MLSCLFCDPFEFFFGDIALEQALADPRKSPELREFVVEVYHSETAALLQEHNGVIQMQREQIAQRDEDIGRLHKEKMEMVARHASNITALHAEHALEVRALHAEHALEVRALHRECTEKLKAVGQ